MQPPSPPQVVHTSVSEPVLTPVLAGSGEHCPQSCGVLCPCCSSQRPPAMPVPPQSPPALCPLVMLLQEILTWHPSRLVFPWELLFAQNNLAFTGPWCRWSWVLSYFWVPELLLAVLDAELGIPLVGFSSGMLQVLLSPGVWG